MAEPDPLWRRVFDSVEHTVASGLDEVMRTEVFAQTLSVAVTSTIRVRRGLEGLTREWLHIWNVPANSDLQHLHDLVLTVDRRVRALARDLERLQADEHPEQD